MATSRRGFLRRFGIGAAGAAATVASSVLPAKAAPEIVEVVREVPVPVAGGLVWAREAFGYGPLQLEEGEVFALTGLRNDLLLTSQGYARVIGKLGIVLCNCGRRFVFDNRGHNYMVDHCARTGHRPANLARPLPAVTVVDEMKVGDVSRRREVTITVDPLELDSAEQVKLAAQLRETLGLPAAVESDPEILEVGGTLRPSLRQRERAFADRFFRRPV